MTTFNIGLFGFGCVGEGFYQIAREDRKVDINFKKIIIKNLQKQRSAPPELFSDNPDDIFNDEEIDLVVELINGTEEAFEIVSAAIKKRIPVVSANKKMLAVYFTELKELVDEYETPILYEGAVCGAIPILRTIDQYFQYDQITQVEGIFNGTTNYILTQQFEENRNFDETLKSAQELGFAELDASSDVDAFDPKYKLKIVAAHAFGLNVPESEILNLGIRNIHEKDIAYARNKGLKYRLLARAIRKEDQVSLFVLPALTKQADTAYTIDNENNFVSLSTKYADNHLLVGKGAGSLPTGAAVYSDAVSILNSKNSYRIPNSAELEFTNDASIEIFVSSAHSESINQVVLDEEYQVFESANYFYKIGKITLDKLIASAKSDVFIGMISENVEFEIPEKSLATT
ncbi:MAG: homoserine dehydrogenase [Bacteroidota bacterium]